MSASSASPVVPDGFPAGYRPAARAVVLDEADRIMLVRFEFPERTVWATPGGGIEPGETVEVALRRELDEELGLRDVEIGPHLWTRTVHFPMGRWLGQCDVVHLVRTTAFQPQPRLTWEQLRAEAVHELRWWQLGDLLEAQGDAVTRFAPRALVPTVQRLLLDGPPARPHRFDS
ncbi:MAG: NUDIX domain-containing protein [Acidimicrobiia bacterium]